MSAHLIAKLNDGRVRIILTKRTSAEHVPYPSTFPPELRDGPGFVRSYVEITLRLANAEQLTLRDRLLGSHVLRQSASSLGPIYGHEFIAQEDGSYVARWACSGPGPLLWELALPIVFDGEHFRNRFTGEHHCHEHLCPDPDGFRPNRGEQAYYWLGELQFYSRPGEPR